jgi:hypothetical protein
MDFIRQPPTVAVIAGVVVVLSEPHAKNTAACVELAFCGYTNAEITCKSKKAHRAMP